MYMKFYIRMYTLFFLIGFLGGSQQFIPQNPNFWQRRRHEPIFTATVLSLLEEFSKTLTYYCSSASELRHHEVKPRLILKSAVPCPHDSKTTPSWAKTAVFVVFCTRHRGYEDEAWFLPRGL